MWSCLSGYGFQIFQYTSIFARLRNLAKTDKMGTTALGLVKAAQEFGFEIKAIKADMSLFNIKDLPLPFIAHVIKNKELEHYYVVINYGKSL